MGRYVVSSRDEQQKMLQDIGLKSLDDLYTDVPSSVLLEKLDLPEGKSELDVRKLVSALSEKNQVYRQIYRGAGAYDHYIPAIVRSVVNKEEFVTAYTPYQAEISQGILQSIFEYQTQMCELTGLDVSNASVYDGAVACAEAVMMTLERKKNTVLVSEGLNTQYQTVINTYAESRSVNIRYIPLKDGKTDLAALEAELNEDTAGVLVQSPNFYGVIEDVEKVSELAHSVKAKAVYVANPIALALLKSAYEAGADICVGEGQPLGMPLSYGGPYLGFMTCRKELMRRLPGRIVGETTDHDGRRAFVLTLQAREQHIRREKASSNICSNEALCALTASVYLASMGYSGLKQAALNSVANAHYLAEKLVKSGSFKLKYGQEFFHEFVTECADASKVEKLLAEKGILSGLVLNDTDILWCTTENNEKEEMDELVRLLAEVKA